MGADRGFPTQFKGPDAEGRKPIRVVDRTRILMTEQEVEALHQETGAALREWDEQRATELHLMQEDDARELRIVQD